MLKSEELIQKMNHTIATKLLHLDFAPDFFHDLESAITALKAASEKEPFMLWWSPHEQTFVCQQNMTGYPGHLGDTASQAITRAIYTWLNGT